MSEFRFFESVEKRRNSNNELVDTVVLRLEHSKGLSKVERDATEDDKLRFAIEFKEFEDSKPKEEVKKPSLFKK